MTEKDVDQACRKFGDNLRRLRENKNLSKSELCRRADMHINTLMSYESGEKTPTIRTLIRIARALGCELFISFRKAEIDEND